MELDNLLEYFAPEIGWTPLAKEEARGKITEYVDRQVAAAVKKEKMIRLAAQIRESELKAKLEPFENFAARILESEREL